MLSWLEVTLFHFCTLLPSRESFTVCWEHATSPILPQMFGEVPGGPGMSCDARSLTPAQGRSIWVPSHLVVRTSPAFLCQQRWLPRLLTSLCPSVHPARSSRPDTLLCLHPRLFFIRNMYVTGHVCVSLILMRWFDIITLLLGVSLAVFCLILS